MRDLFNMSMKDTVLDYVEHLGGATFSQIQRFIVEINVGPGRYDEMERAVTGTNKDGEWRYGLKRRWRGYYCGALTKKNGYFLKGPRRLYKVPGPATNKYIVIYDNPA